MNIPGFTAEASLYQTGEHYHAALEGTHASGSVYPAQLAELFNPLVTLFINPNPYEIYCRKFKCWRVPYVPYLKCDYVIERC
jgi:hypothetical protein